MSPVFPVFHSVTTVSWSQKRMLNDNIHSTILDVHVFKVWHLKMPFSVEPASQSKYINKSCKLEKRKNRKYASKIWVEI